MKNSNHCFTFRAFDLIQERIKLGHSFLPVIKFCFWPNIISLLSHLFAFCQNLKEQTIMSRYNEQSIVCLTTADSLDNTTCQEQKACSAPRCEPSEYIFVTVEKSGPLLSLFYNQISVLVFTSKKGDQSIYL